MPHCLNPRCQTDYPPGTTRCKNPFCQCLLPEAVVAGRYRIETLIGIGGMGAVYRVSDTFEMEQVALKVLSLVQPAMDMPTAVERFRREARYAHQLKHKHIVPVLNFGQDGDLLYLAMPLITGGTLKGLLKAGQPLPIQQAQGYVNDMAAAIDAVHAHPQQIVHRDIKPSNLLIHQDDGRLVLADFGIARAMQQEQALTQRGWSLGTEHYIAPEQEHGNAQPTSDVYAMGVVVYQMFTGLLPFQAIVKSHSPELPPPSKLNHALPPSVDRVIMRAMDTDPANRFQSAGAFAKALNDALDAESIWSAPTIAAPILATNTANVIIRMVSPENPCSRCGRENRSSSRFCRHCGQSLDATVPAIEWVCQFGYASETGKRARDNEDMLLIAQGLCTTLGEPPHPFGLFAVADGLRGTQGKMTGGHEASQLAIETVADMLLPHLAYTTQTVSRSTPSSNSSDKIKQGTSLRPSLSPEKLLEQWIKEGVQQSNKVIYHFNADFDTQMGSTITLALLYQSRLYVANVGDSRTYHFNKKQGLQQMTTDHTLAANLVQAQLLAPDEVYKSAKRDQHYRSLGNTYQVTVDTFQREIEPDDLVVLCTDGLWHMVRDQRIEELLARGGDAQQLADRLTDEANRAGGEGNVSAIVVKVQ